MQKLRIIVGGLVGQYPLGGVAWDYFHYVLGLHELGHDVYYHEDTWVWPFDPIKGYPTDDSNYTVNFIRDFFETYAPHVREKWHYLLLHEKSHGMPRGAFDDVVRTADVFLNVSGACFFPDHLNPKCKKVFLDTDPGYNQIMLAERFPWSQFVERWCKQVEDHDVHLTYAENIYAKDCAIPRLHFDWRPTRCVATLAPWNAVKDRPPPKDAPFTTVMTWNWYGGKLEHNGVEYEQKVKEYDKFHDLPRRTRVPLALCVGGHKTPYAQIREDGWQVIDAHKATLTPTEYLKFVQGSAGEWSIAKNVYTATNSGWFSCRTACYLAAGRPAVVQDTKWSRYVPSGQGVIGFDTMDETLIALREVHVNWKAHSCAAYDVAREYLAPDRVLPRMLDDIFAARAPVPSPLRERVRMRGDSVSRGARSRRPPHPNPLPEGEGVRRPQLSPEGRGGKSHLTIVVGGYIIGYPLGGMTWHHLNYLLGLHALGHEVWFLEDSGAHALPYNPRIQRCDRDSAYGRAYLEQTFGAYALPRRYCYYSQFEDKHYGMTRDELHDVLARADLMICVSGVTPLRDTRPRPKRTLVIDTDPVFTQLRMSHDAHLADYWRSFDHVATFGRLIGTDDCPLPMHGLQWIATNQPVSLAHWPFVEPMSAKRFTTIGKWEHASDRAVEFNARRLLSSKSPEWMKVIGLPTRAPVPLTLAMESMPGDVKRTFESHGWTWADAEAATATTEAYREFVSESAGEFTVAKEIYAAVPSGWFSDRSACYLATGRPVVTQSTGFESWLPVGEGLMSFTTVDEAAAALTKLASAPARHGRAARQIAERYFDSRTVLTELLDAVL